MCVLTHSLFALIPFYNNAKSDSCLSDSVSIWSRLTCSGLFKWQKGFTLHWSDLRMLASVRWSRSVQICFSRYGIAPFSPSLCLCSFYTNTLLAVAVQVKSQVWARLLREKKNNSQGDAFHFEWEIVDPEMLHVSYWITSGPDSNSEGKVKTWKCWDRWKWALEWQQESILR